jgi:F-type H+-transporting ATPase subunit a
MVLGYGTAIIPLFFSIFMTLLEILVAFIQAYVFTLLSAIYIGMATEEEHA